MTARPSFGPRLPESAVPVGSSSAWKVPELLIARESFASARVLYLAPLLFTACLAVCYRLGEGRPLKGMAGMPTVPKRPRSRPSSRSCTGRSTPERGLSTRRTSEVTG